LEYKVIFDPYGRISTEPMIIAVQAASWLFALALTTRGVAKQAVSQINVHIK